MEYRFPNEWKVLIEDREDLAIATGFSVHELENIEAAVPSNYHPKRIIRNGKNRNLAIPSKKLKGIQRVFLAKLFSMQFPKYLHGGIEHRSIVTNAQLHLNRKWVACLDIHRFFPSIRPQRVSDVLVGMGFGKEAVQSLVHFVTYNHELPQGSPTSPVLANLTLHEFDKRVQALCKARGLRYSRFFDDVTISGDKRLESACVAIIKICSESGFKINPLDSRKFRIMSRAQDQVVTGLVVNGPTLKANKAFLQSLNKRIDDLASGKTDNGNFRYLFDQTAGMIAFLRGVDADESERLNHRLLSVDWAAYGLAD